MVKGVSVKFVSYQETVPRLLQLIKFDQELKKHENIVLKPHIDLDLSTSTNREFVEAVVRFCVTHRNPGTEIFIAEGVDGADTMDVFEEHGYKKLAERYGIGLIDLNRAESESIGSNEFAGFESIMFPSMLKNSFVVSLPTLRVDSKTDMMGAIATMHGAFPAQHYKGWFSIRKNKLDNYPIKHQLHDLMVCGLPSFALMDAREKGLILAGQPLEVDKQASKLIGLDWHSIGYLRMLDETIGNRKPIVPEKGETANS